MSRHYRAESKKTRSQGLRSAPKKVLKRLRGTAYSHLTDTHRRRSEVSQYKCTRLAFSLRSSWNHRGSSEIWYIIALMLMTDSFTECTCSGAFRTFDDSSFLHIVVFVECQPREMSVRGVVHFMTQS